MKELTIMGRTFQYKITYYFSEYGDRASTEFFEGKETIKKKKYWLFGEEIEKEVPKHSFTIHIDIEDETYTKNEIRTRLIKKIELLNRKKEIERGEII